MADKKALHKYQTAVSLPRELMVLYKFYERRQRGGEPFVPVVDQLLPDGQVEALHVQAHERAFLNLFLRNEVRQEGDAAAVFHAFT
mgnify:CR=1 FL=1